MSRQAELNHQRIDRLEDAVMGLLVAIGNYPRGVSPSQAMETLGKSWQTKRHLQPQKVSSAPVQCSINSERLLSLIARLNYVLQIDAEQLPTEWQDTENMYIQVIEALITSKRSDQLAEGLAVANEDVRVFRSYIQNLAFTAGIDESEFNELGCEKVSSLLEQVIQDSELYRRKLAAIRAAL